LYFCILCKAANIFIEIQLSYFSARLLEGFQQNDGVDGLYRYESRERFTIPGGAVRCRKKSKKEEMIRFQKFRFRKEAKKRKMKKKKEIAFDNSAIVVEPVQ